MIKLKIMEWNIHQQGRQYKNRKSGDGEIPLWIVNEIPDDVNIVVFTEFNYHAQNVLGFYNSLTAKGFCYSTTNYSCAWSNDILIAIRGKEIAIKSTSHVKAYSDIPNTTLDVSFDNIPENLRVDINVNGIDIHFWGIRIKGLNGKYEKRKIEMETVMHWLQEADGINILVGDFNNLKENTTRIKEWNLTVLDNLLGYTFERKTPNNHSWGVSQSRDDGSFDGYIKNDHLIHTKEIHATVESYIWKFLENCNYSLKSSQYGKKELNIPVGEPDHGILIATCLIFDKNDYTTIGEYFPNGGETYTIEDLLYKIETDLGYDKEESEILIEKSVEKGFITACGNNTYTR